MYPLCMNQTPKCQDCNINIATDHLEVYKDENNQDKTYDVYLCDDCKRKVKAYN